ncbi:bis(5'-nucleosyl)-tetraphosphatase (symmetrical) YqeK [Pelosinus sp. sgz500959]|uniref:bis(5'-nucleosyl)-tetraphosphatase (symmetrical) YqeK n=1 Tax=Pelosinus sp. sgz500959 TaxID=3242472 RepID=UPI00366DE4D5
MKYAKMLAEVAKRLSSKRFSHSIGVSETAECLAVRFHCDTEKAKIAGLLHDLAREVPMNELLPRAQAFGIVVNDIEQAEPILLHPLLGAKLAQAEFGIDDAEILQAIILHTTAGESMTILDKIIYLADVIEPGRGFKGVDSIREMAQVDLDKALLAALDQSIDYLVKRCGLIHPATIAARNEILLKKREC